MEPDSPAGQQPRSPLRAPARTLRPLPVSRAPAGSGALGSGDRGSLPAWHAHVGSGSAPRTHTGETPVTVCPRPCEPLMSAPLQSASLRTGSCRPHVLACTREQWPPGQRGRPPCEGVALWGHWCHSATCLRSTSLPPGPSGAVSESQHFRFSKGSRFKQTRGGAEWAVLSPERMSEVWLSGATARGKRTSGGGRCATVGAPPRPSPALVGAQKEVSRRQAVPPSEWVLTCGLGQPWARGRSQCPPGV